MDSMMLAAELVKYNDTFLIGSTAFNVQTEDSDIDICAYKYDLPKSLRVQIAKEGNKVDKSYNDSLILQHSTLYKFDELDVFIFSDITKLIVVKAVVDIMKTYPTIILKIKWVRVWIFRTLLKKHGFLI